MSSSEFDGNVDSDHFGKGLYVEPILMQNWLSLEGLSELGREEVICIESA